MGMVLLQLFWEFFKIGLISIGGGMATIPFLYNIATRYDWFTEAMLVNMIAISESTPGPIGVNMATYAGFNAAGVPGALVATFSMILPALFIVTFVAMFLAKFTQSPLVGRVFYGLRPAVVGLIAAAAFSVIKICLVAVKLAGWTLQAHADIPSVLLFGAVLVCTFRFKKIHPVAYIAIGALAGILLKVGHVPIIP